MMKKKHIAVSNRIFRINIDSSNEQRGFFPPSEVVLLGATMSFHQK